MNKLGVERFEKPSRPQEQIKKILEAIGYGM